MEPEVNRHKRARHRGPDPEDQKAFSKAAWPVLRQAASDLNWLLDHGYAVASASELVANRYELSTRQRLALTRCACSTADRHKRKALEVGPAALRGQEVWLDGFNVLTGLESALGGGVILLGGDECCRDVAGLHRRYHKVEETLPALRLAGAYLAARGVAKAVWWLDKPVANSGRLRTLLLSAAAEANWDWTVGLVPNPDSVLSATDRIIVTADRAVLDRSQRWFNLVRVLIQEHIGQAWLVDLSLPAPGE